MAVIRSIVPLFVAALFAVSALAAPEPDLVPRSWEFEFEFKHPRPIAVKNLQGEYEWYWYMTYDVVNNTGQERLFIPEFTIATDKGDLVIAGKGISTSVFQAVKKHVGNDLLESPASVIGRILQGEDNGKESVIIWKAFGHNVEEVNVFVSGLSGETAVVKVPDPEDTSKTVEKLMTKTLQINYAFHGAPLKPEDQPVQPKGTKWIMR